MISLKMKKEAVKLYIFLLIASMIYIIPILWSGRYYKDDLSRTLTGATGWVWDGRPVGEWLMRALTGFFASINDIAPLSWLIAVAIISYGLTIYAQNRMMALQGKWYSVLPLLFVVTNPFAIENWSYRFDCVIMFTALCLVFLLYAIDWKKKVIEYVCFFAMTVLVMSIYQPAIGMCIVLSVLDIFYAVTNKDKFKETLIHSVIRLAMVGIGAIVYKVTVAKYCISELGWQKQASELMHGTVKELLLVLYNNVVYAFRFMLMVWKSYAPIYLYIVIAVIIASWVCGLRICIRSSRGGKKVLQIAFCAVLPAVALVGNFLPLVVLNSLQWDSKKFLAFGGFLLVVSYVLLVGVESQTGKKICITLLCICLFHQFIYMTTYGNVLRSQKEYDEYLAHSMAYDLGSLCDKEDEIQLSFVGVAPRSRVTSRMIEKYPHFENTVPVYFTNDTWIGGAYLYRYISENIKIEPISDGELEAMRSSGPVFVRNEYSGYQVGNRIVFEFH